MKLSGYVAIRSNAGFFVMDNGTRRRAVRLAPKGTPDIVACAPGGRFVAVECKTEKGRLTPQQEAFLDALKKNGAVVLVVRSLEELIAGLDKGFSTAKKTC